MSKTHSITIRILSIITLAAFIATQSAPVYALRAKATGEAPKVAKAIGNALGVKAQAGGGNPKIARVRGKPFPMDGFHRLALRLKPLLDTIVEPLDSWEETRAWMEQNIEKANRINNRALGRQGAEERQLAFQTFCTALYVSGKIKEDWHNDARQYDFTLRLKTLLDTIAEPLDSWEKTRAWLEAHRDEATAINNKALERSDEKTTALSYNSLAEALYRSNKTTSVWGFQAFALDLSLRLQPLLDTIQEPLDSWEKTRAWLEAHRDEAIALNNEVLERSGEEATVLSYGSLAKVLYMSGKTTENLVRYADALELSTRLKPLLDTIKGPLGSWEKTRAWLEAHRDEAIVLNNNASVLSYSTLLCVLYVSGKVTYFWRWEASLFDLSIRLKPILDTIQKPLDSWEKTRAWLEAHRDEAIALNNEALERSEEKATALAYSILAAILNISGKTTEDWTREAGILDLSLRLKPLLDAIKEPLDSWEKVRTWLEAHREQASVLNNEALQRSEEKATVLSYASLACLLFLSGKTTKDWTHQTGALDLALRLKPIFDTIDEPLGSWEDTREWLIRHIDEVNSLNNKALNKKAGRLAYDTVFNALFIVGKVVNGGWSYNAVAMDYARNRRDFIEGQFMAAWQQLNESQKRFSGELLIKAIEHYIHRELFVQIPDWRALVDIDRIKDALRQEAGDEDEARRMLKMSKPRFAKLLPYAKEEAEFVAKQISELYFKKVLREFYYLYGEELIAKLPRDSVSQQRRMQAREFTTPQKPSPQENIFIAGKTRIQHKTFGEGTVTKIEEGAITVKFDRERIPRKLLLEYAPIEIISTASAIGDAFGIKGQAQATGGVVSDVLLRQDLRDKLEEFWPGFITDLNPVDIAGEFANSMIKIVVYIGTYRREEEAVADSRIGILNSGESRIARCILTDEDNDNKPRPGEDIDAMLAYIENSRYEAAATGSGQAPLATRYTGGSLGTSLTSFAAQAAGRVVSDVPLRQDLKDKLEEFWPAFITGLNPLNSAGEFLNSVIKIVAYVGTSRREGEAVAADRIGILNSSESKIVRCILTDEDNGNRPRSEEDTNAILAYIERARYEAAAAGANGASVIPSGQISNVAAREGRAQAAGVLPPFPSREDLGIPEEYVSKEPPPFRRGFESDYTLTHLSIQNREHVIGTKAAAEEARIAKQRMEQEKRDLRVDLIKQMCEESSLPVRLDILYKGYVYGRGSSKIRAIVKHIKENIDAYSSVTQEELLQRAKEFEKTYIRLSLEAGLLRACLAKAQAAGMRVAVVIDVDSARRDQLVREIEKNQLFDKVLSAENKSQAQALIGKERSLPDNADAVFVEIEKTGETYSLSADGFDTKDQVSPTDIISAISAYLQDV